MGNMAVNTTKLLSCVLLSFKSTPMPNSQYAVQKAFVQKLKELAPANTSLAEEIAELLNVSADSAYRRLRGETAISLDEAVTLCTHFKIPFSAFTETLAGLVTFRYRHLDENEESFYQYLQSLDQTLDKLLMANEKRIVYGAVDISILQHLGFRQISNFKMYYWMRALMGVKRMQDKKFDPNLISAEMQQVANSIHKKYLKVPSTEIWSDDMLFPTLKQIEYSWESGWFENRDAALAVCENLREMIFTTREWAAQGSKLLSETKEERPQNYKLYFSELLIGNNTIMAYLDSLKAVFLSHHTFNNINTTDVRFCDETEEWLEKHMQKSTLISGTAEKQRVKFFNLLEKNIDRVIEKIKAD